MGGSMTETKTGSQEPEAAKRLTPGNWVAQPGAVVTATCSAPAVHSTSLRSGVTMNAHGTSAVTSALRATLPPSTTGERRTNDGRKGQEPRSAVVGEAAPRQPAIGSGACCARQRVELPWGSMLFARPAGSWRTLAGVRARSISNGGSTPGHDLRNRYLDPVRGALPGDGGQARVDAADGRTGWLRWTVSRNGPDAVKRLSSPTRTWAGTCGAVPPPSVGRRARRPHACPRQREHRDRRGPASERRSSPRLEHSSHA